MKRYILKQLLSTGLCVTLLFFVWPVTSFAAKWVKKPADANVLHIEGTCQKAVSITLYAKKDNVLIYSGGAPCTNKTFLFRDTLSGWNIDDGTYTIRVTETATDANQQTAEVEVTQHEPTPAVLGENHAAEHDEETSFFQGITDFAESIESLQLATQTMKTSLPQSKLPGLIQGALGGVLDLAEAEITALRNLLSLLTGYSGKESIPTPQQHVLDQQATPIPSLHPEVTGSENVASEAAENKE